MNGQTELFYEDVYEALRAAIAALGGSKAVGQRLKPDTPVHEAQNWVNACLNRNRSEQFHPEQVLFILGLARKANCHQPFAWWCNAAGYEAGRPRAPVDECADLQRKFVESVELQRQILERLERLAQGPVRSIR